MAHRTLISAHDGFQLPAFAYAANGAAQGSVVVLQEIFGVTPHIEEMCGVFASEGYQVLAPAMFERAAPGLNVASDAEGLRVGREALAATPWAQAVTDVQAAIDALPKPCFVTGFCWGGTTTWAAAARCEGVAAAASFYGRQIPDLLAPAPRAPIMLHYGAHDASIPPENIETVRAAAPASPLYIYDAGHGFCRRGSHDFNEAARDLALARTLDWFARWR